MSPGVRLICATAALIACAIATAHAQPTDAASEKVVRDAERLADLLFPESHDWARVAELPVLATREFDQSLASALGREYDASPAAEAVCVMINMFMDDTPRGQFHVLAREGPGTPDVLYVGSQPCAEGDWTVIWTKSHPAIRLPGRAFRIRLGPEPRVVMFESGCCADPNELFGVRDPFAPAGRIWIRGIRSTKWLDLPLQTRVEQRDLVFRRELVLRWKPVDDDRYNEDLSRFLGTAAFGSIARRFLPGVTARQIGAYTDPGGTQWALVTIDNEFEYLAEHTVFTMDLGWTKLESE